LSQGNELDPHIVGCINLHAGHGAGVAEVKVSEQIKVKPFWKSTSFWLTIITCIGVVLDKLVAGGVIPNEGWIAIVIGVIGLVTKRGLTENTAIKANALLEANKNQNPPVG
jgi:hypothetical protein